MPRRPRHRRRRHRPRAVAAVTLVALVASACASQGNHGKAAAGEAGGGAGRTSTTAAASAPGGEASGSWGTYHHDGGRSGYDPSASPSSRPTVRWSVALDGDALAEPLVFGSEVIVATEHDVVAAFDARTGTPRWSTHLGEPVPGSALPCGDIDPSGVTGTPVIDTATGTVWVVAFVSPGHHELFGLDATTGAVRSTRQVDPPGVSALLEQQRGALALANGTVYVPYGGLFGDCGNYHGYVIGIPEAGGAAISSFRVSVPSGAAIWAPSGPAVAGDRSLLVATGNGEPSLASGQAESVLRLSPGLGAVDSFTASDFAELDQDDLDLGSTGPALLPGGLVFQIGKSGVGYVLHEDHLGGVGGQAFSARVCQGAFGAVAVGPPGNAGPVPGGPAVATVVVACVDGLVSLRVGSDARFSVAWSRPDLDVGPPVEGRGTMFVLDTRHGELLSVDPLTGATITSVPVGQANRFATPALGADLVYAGAGSKLVALG